MTPGQVQAFARDEFDPKAASTIVVGDAKLFLPAVKALTPDVKVIPIAEFDPEGPSLKAAP